MTELGPWLQLCARRLPERGSILLRGLGVRRQATFRELVSVFMDSDLSYEVGALQWPAEAGVGRAPPPGWSGERPFMLHHERTYSSARPSRLWLCNTGEACPSVQIAVADGRDVFRRLPTDVRRRWAERGLMYVRYLGDELDLPWSMAFGTSDWARVESRCRRLGIDWEWKHGGVLRLSKSCVPMLTHPATLERVWFNDAHLCHPGALETRRGVSVLKPPTATEPPLQVYHADGSAIRRSDLVLIRAAFDASKVVIDAQPGDVLMLDNLVTAHGLVRRDGDIQLEFAKEYPGELPLIEDDPMWL